MIKIKSYCLGCWLLQEKDYNGKNKKYMLMQKEFIHWGLLFSPAVKMEGSRSLYVCYFMFLSKKFLVYFSNYLLEG